MTTYTARMACGDQIDPGYKPLPGSPITCPVHGETRVLTLEEWKALPHHLHAPAPGDQTAGGNQPSCRVEHITGMRALAYVAEKFPLDEANGLLLSLRLAPDGDPAQRPAITLGPTHEIRWDATTRDYELTVTR